MAVGENVDDGITLAARRRYQLEPYIFQFADFPSGQGENVLEIGVGMGADHKEWAKHHPRLLAGIDLTPRAIDFTKQSLAIDGLSSLLQVGDAENLPFGDNMFDIVYSWGVLHHSPDTPTAVREVWRVLKPGGKAIVMIYHRWSIVGFMLWCRYALMAGKPWRRLTDIYSNHLESPGTKAYSRAEAAAMFADFSKVHVAVQLNHGDLLQGEVGQRHQGRLLTIAKAVWPRWLIRSLFSGLGLYLLISAEK
ncbi:MAG: class I SAM-dependent methyltransferase [Proteobacteria bacterium]|nr:class I SAM-dependent methyltransferase [Pseudomonadota bacterium]MDA1325379.1 class I SAM-dependent methyltransferase [Pseudomonadota bacterium]